MNSSREHTCEEKSTKFDWSRSEQSDLIQSSSRAPITFLFLRHSTINNPLLSAILHLKESSVR